MDKWISAFKRSVPILFALPCVMSAFGACAQVAPCPSVPPPAGYRMVGQSPSSPGLAGVPLCIYDGPSSQGAPSSGADTDFLTPLVRSYANELGRDTDGMRKLSSDPEFQRWRDGFWVAPKRKPDAPHGEYCSAVFLSLKGAMQLSGPGGNMRKAVMTLWGKDIPTPDKAKVVDIKLHQGTDWVAKTRALNRSMIPGQIGALDIEVPSIEAMLGSMTEDELVVRAEIDGHTVIDLSTYDRIRGRDLLKHCVEAK